MDLSLSDEQKQLQEQAERFVRDKYTFENRRKIAATERGWLPENWAQFAELGWLAIPFSEDDGGIGFGPIETMIVMEQFGKGLVLEPFLPTVVLGGGLIAARRLEGPEGGAAGADDRGQEAVRAGLAGAAEPLQPGRRLAQGDQGRRRLVALRPQGRGLQRRLRRPHHRARPHRRLLRARRRASPCSSSTARPRG